ncbi:DUF3084 domain-containing protein [Gloeothece verrucosa]|uniref:DUF3084 domain-containing protein n=1 Tax=Gloeothece verrucosa (strain PCC 7822) TaxID=497965 RepID=E0UB53_GLOV7|nr:DUF3084 domain-containing protein [Gloeothece verrucosa]ADN16298.1 conserved hypothetical protein [Gloeothece verrucosa PCC 7822]
MTSAFILITAILILGGLIAALGDRIGSKIGKKKLRLFNLRPRQTAVLVTIVTGIAIAGSTLALLFSLSKSLRQGVFDLDKLLNERRDAIKKLETNLQTVKEEKTSIEKELNIAQTKQTSIQKRLSQLNKDFKKSRSQFDQVSSQLTILRSDIQSLLEERQDLVEQRQKLTQTIENIQKQVQEKDQQLTERENSLAQQDKKLAQQNQQLTQQDQIIAENQSRIQQLEKAKNKLQNQIKQRDSKISFLDKAIAQKDENLKSREEKLGELENQLAFLKREVEVLEQYYQNYQDLRERKIAILKGQVLSLGAFRLTRPESDTIIKVIDQLLQEANRTAIMATRPESKNTDERLVKITKAQVEQLIQTLKDGGEYVVRIISAGNYVLGEQEIRVFADVVPNQKIFDEEQEIAAVSIDSGNLTEEEIQKRLDILLSAAQFRARRQGILGTIQIGDGSLTKLVQFIQQVNSSEQPLDEIQAVASEPTYTAGPLKLRLVAVRDGKVIFST